MTPLLLLIALFAPSPDYSAELVQRAQVLHLAEDPQWIALGHWRDGWGDRTSEIDSAEFFSAPDGRSNAQAELTSTLRSFFAPAVKTPAALGVSRAQQHPQCRYPARFTWLAAQLKFNPARITIQPCPAYRHWRAALNATGVSLIFADAWLANPASMYGHTMLRFDRAGGGAHLLDYALTYGVTDTMANGVLYALLGILGGFDGQFSTTPFYLKIQEYENVESRDLWIWPLQTSPTEFSRLLAHAWELGGTTMDYFFFTENCSYQLMALLDAMSPALRLTQAFNRWVIPTDTVRAMADRAGRMGSPQWRPAHVTRMRALRDRLSPAQRSAAGSAAEGELKPSEAFPPQQRAMILDAAYYLLRFKHGFVRDGDTEFRSQERQLLRARARLQAPKPPEPERTKAAPHTGHRTLRWAVGGGWGDAGGHTRLETRFALHDLLDPARGYLPTQALEMGNLKLRVDLEPGASLPYIERLDLVHILALVPLERWYQKLSWRARGGLQQATHLGCAGWACTVAALRVGVGGAISGASAEPFYTLLELDTRLFGPLDDYALIGLGGSAGWRTTAGPWAAHLSGEAFYDVIGAEVGPRWRARLGQSLSLSEAVALRLELVQGTQQREAALKLVIYR